jgi:hypothetical protein
MRMALANTGKRSKAAVVVVVVLAAERRGVVCYCRQLGSFA